MEELTQMQKIIRLLKEMESNYILANAFYDRDKDESWSSDIAAIAVARGISQGMKLMRTVIEKSHPTKP